MIQTKGGVETSGSEPFSTRPVCESQNEISRTLLSGELIFSSLRLLLHIRNATRRGDFIIWKEVYLYYAEKSRLNKIRQDY